MASERSVLVVDDEPGIVRLIKTDLQTEGFDVQTALTGQEALDACEQHRPDVVLLDVMLPDMSGLEVMRELRKRMDVPVILLTARDKETDKVRGLEFGADDYLTKPFSPEELAARMRAVLRQSSATEPATNILLVGDVEIDLNARLVKRGGKIVSLTRTEWMLLQHMASRAGKVLTNNELLVRVWGSEYRDELQYLRVWMSRLRKKLEANPSEPRLIRTLPGIGYKLDLGGSPEASDRDGESGVDHEEITLGPEDGAVIATAAPPGVPGA